MAKELANFRQGDTKVIKIVNTTTGYDVTGHVFWFTLREKFDDVTPIAQLQTTAGTHPLDDIPNNTIYIEMGSDITKAIPVGKYFWDIQRSEGGTPPVIITILPTEKNLKDKIEVLEQVTKVES